MRSKICCWQIVYLLLAAILLHDPCRACGPEEVGGFQIPDVQRRQVQRCHGADWPA